MSAEAHERRKDRPNRRPQAGLAVGVEQKSEIGQKYRIDEPRRGHQGQGENIQSRRHQADSPNQAEPQPTPTHGKDASQQFAEENRGAVQGRGEQAVHGLAIALAGDGGGGANGDGQQKNEGHDRPSHANPYVHNLAQLLKKIPQGTAGRGSPGPALPGAFHQIPQKINDDPNGGNEANADKDSNHNSAKPSQSNSRFREN